MDEKNNLEIKGRIHSFESLGAVDGPGVRYIIFTQGCHLRCKYCQNRDTWATNSGKFYTVDQIVKQVLRYKNYITPNGGITVSGGEPLLQPQFIIALFTELKKYNIHTCIDTSGTFDITPTIEKIIDLTDLFLLDIKAIDDAVCKDLTGVSNKKELEFAKYLSNHNKPMWIRQVLIPGITDKENDLEKLHDFISTLNSVQKVEILPYHDLGKFKWEKLNCVYPLEGVRTANSDDVRRAKHILRNIKLLFL